jgi:hypothetical protein
VTIGDHCDFGPNVTIVTPVHPMLADERRAMRCADGKSVVSVTPGRFTSVTTAGWAQCGGLPGCDGGRQLCHRRRKCRDQGCAGQLLCGG